ncbi:hypothetical protein [Pseudomonas sp. Q1]|uniref:hypothetical protein n=1 Tax=Pseudomonas sp. Q1 TaxID=2202823 RepID=UPI0013752271|nr:hypothetical protein [Pseudomonas sp. Q1]NCE83794.1 hypothetical protein [Pseudomonas sp. Q1]
MTTEIFEEELPRARVDRTNAIAEIMALVRDRKAFGEKRKAANERESIARRKIARLLDTVDIR